MAQTARPKTRKHGLRPDDQLRKLQLLLDFDLKIAKAKTLDQLLELLVEQTRQLLEADRATVFLFDKASGQLWSRLGHGLSGKTISLAKGQGLIGHVFSSRKPLNIADAYKDKRFSASADRQTGYRTRTVLAVPMMDSHKKEALGVFQALNKRAAGPFDRQDEALLTILADHAAVAVQSAQLYEDLQRAQEETVLRLGLMAEYRDPKDTAGHLKRMSAYSAIIARTLGFDEEYADTLRLAASLHDIGKVATPDAILMKTGKLGETELGGLEYRLAWWMEKLKLSGKAEAQVRQVAEWLADIRLANKPSSTGMPQDLQERIRQIASQRMIDRDGQEKPLLTEEEVEKLTIKRGNLTPYERREMEKHTAYGARMVSGAASRLLQLAERIAASHHEKYDGTGYPDGLKGDKIPIEGRIAALADVFDALVSRRVYKPGWTLDETLAFVRQESGKHFDPKVVDALLASLPQIKQTMDRLMEKPDVPVR
jgi:response regulator RpfG family c-di-GMP phosphodiesterase